VKSHQRVFQLQECAQQFVRMDDIAATVSASVNHPAQAVLRDSDAIAPGPAILTELGSPVSQIGCSSLAINAYRPPHVPDQTLPVSNDGLAIVARHAVAKRYKEENYYLQSTDKLSKNTVASPLAFIVICAISCTK
jgi:hypothetical protein